ncbi:TPA: DUF2283 domain-containing protein [Candidatus Bathyarchaeota archaeon]|nr:DUF2283 domain-containing protein [Candidatus Bathyarchaeota archaeon]
MAHRMRHDPEADVLTVTVSRRASLHAEEMGDLIVHVNEEGKPLFLEILNASTVIPSMVRTLAKKELVVG